MITLLLSRHDWPVETVTVNDKRHEIEIHAAMPSGATKCTPLLEVRLNSLITGETVLWSAPYHSVRIRPAKPNEEETHKDVMS